VKPETVRHKVTETDSGTRVDKFLVTICLELTRSRIQNLIVSRNVRINGAVVRASYRLKTGDLVELEIPEPTVTDLVSENIAIDIIYEDADLIVVSKPRGMVVHPGAGVSSGTLVNALMYHCRDLSGVGGELRPGIIHRLDKGTSGVMVAAKHDHAHVRLSGQFAARTIRKEYRALVIGIPDWTEIETDAPIRRHPVNRKKMAVQPGGRQAFTHFKMVGVGTEISLIAAYPRTGRTHQIRVHLNSLGFPILGDSLYGFRFCRKPVHSAINAKLKKLDGFCLHAARIQFRHPESGEKLDFSVPVTEDFQEIERMASVQLIYS